jgi:hypothetical protein
MDRPRTEAAVKRSWLAGTLVSIGLAAMLLIWFGFGGDRAGHARAKRKNK